MTLAATIAGAYPKIGDLPEEQKLRKAFHDFDKGIVSDEELEQIMSEVTEVAIREQIEAGMDVVTDGLIRWEDALTYQARKISGFKIGGLTRFFDTNTFYRQPIVESRLEASKPMTIADYQFAAGKTEKPVRMVLTGPYTIAKLSKNEFYREFKQMVFDLAYIIHAEIKALEEAGCKFIQIDEPAILSNKEDLALFLKAWEIVTAGLTQAEKTLFLNFGNIGAVYPKILNVAVERIGFELTPGHPNWEVIKEKPVKDKKLMAGLVDARNTKMESETNLAEAVRELETQVGGDNLWISTSHSLEFLPRTCAKNKMYLIANVVKQLKGASVS
ncbi:MAG: hypothetical protein A3G33_09900 [Omnitrophica bacterium RIFCSPLOWO2_12_FULL_44_17]|uniref:Cobalamin-independent methionine synthase MetE C-terminal/archaeal domain-containing protein n=1 Tax=Candidatus Danuiimicrobium aquiferis TaxID=1801832 RepID=A0A1G1L1W3_9BACT|nr:MAG: hypothetical protein A3B72_08710 [Omnitrophica bacterium RIFCSPHIGHO2_02_FULL_45_28]OGW88252.1 MAG: hypothetical protein A3E74_02700 [Omnitrophica bacterium RIFCSPHIGHO2_12_FULL_44_12]OGW99137.1 MAG: hypothetical protein A3G33_09900 [Omnitrophica bacterium RIFCSPLOWO2_12_FULL_44_17]OGX03166.1 MAG: hypothetical protein A3J12_09700 [Omnitrophica bacterium RIFCSPLOWO2_02_FULL_44_11]